MLKAESICFSYKDHGQVRLKFQDVNFQVERGEIVSLLGESGTGKSTLARILAGLLPYESGRVTCAGKEVKQPDSPVALVFQDYKNAVFPWLTVEQNIMLGLAKPNSAGRGIMGLDGVVKILKINGLLSKYPSELSGGQIQRIQLGRALVGAMDFLILDEPDTSLDMEFKRQLHELIAELVAMTSIGIFLVTHSIDRAVHMSKRIYVIRRGRDNEAEVLEKDGADQEGEFTQILGTQKFQEIYQCIYGKALH
jgi:ABC-type nitrate/sulfonate/bicarbonate transport system ATPase subunit